MIISTAKITTKHDDDNDAIINDDDNGDEDVGDDYHHYLHHHHRYDYHIGYDKRKCSNDPYSPYLVLPRSHLNYIINLSKSSSQSTTKCLHKLKLCCNPVTFGEGQGHSN